MKGLPSISLTLLLAFTLAACGGSDAPDAGAADVPASAAPTVELPVTDVELGPIDAALAAEGQQVYETRCTTCHRMDSRYVGPPLGTIMADRDPVYIMNMILAPEKMLQTDETARELLAEYGVPMTNQNLTYEEARSILEYLRQLQETP